MEIYRGSNDPLLFEMSEEFHNITKFSAVLTQKWKIKKTWDLSNAVIDQGILKLPMSERDTMQLVAGDALLDMKGLDESGRILIADTVHYTVITNLNNTVMTEG